MTNDEQKQRHWTLQQFTTVAGKPWYALHEQTDAGVERGFTGYRYEMDELAARLGIVPEELEPTTEEEYFSRFDDDDLPAWAGVLYGLPDYRPS
jgi:hypothetical protein